MILPQQYYTYAPCKLLYILYNNVKRGATMITGLFMILVGIQFLVLLDSGVFYFGVNPYDVFFSKLPSILLIIIGVIALFIPSKNNKEKD